MNSTKVCTKCNELKFFDEFSKDKKGKYGLNYTCKSCNKKYKNHYYKTINGLITQIYTHQRANSINRNHPYPSYSKSELKDWLISQNNFEKLFKNWKFSNYDPKLTPSVDRENDYLPYEFGNITLMTWKENKDKACADIKNGTNNKTSKAVLQFYKNGEFIKEYRSASEAKRQLNIQNSDISKCCYGHPDYSHAGGFVWKFKNN